MLDLGAWMTMQSKVEIYHRCNVKQYVVLSQSIKKAWHAVVNLLFFVGGDLYNGGEAVVAEVVAAVVVVIAANTVNTAAATNDN